MPELGRFPGEENGQPTPVFLPDKSHEVRSVMGYKKKKKSRKNSCKRVGHDLVTKQQQTLMFIPTGLHRGASGLGC